MIENVLDTPNMMDYENIIYFIAPKKTLILSIIIFKSRIIKFSNTILWPILENIKSFFHIKKYFNKYTMKKGCFAIGFATQFLNCNEHLQLSIFIRCEF
jgi:hypothetical protein